MADRSTERLMRTLYRLRSEDTTLTKAEALRQAQLVLLQDAGGNHGCSK